MPGGEPLLAVEDLSVAFVIEEASLPVVNGVGFELFAGQTLALVGESGSGKSVTALSLMGLIEPPGQILGGTIRLVGEDLLGASEARLTELRGDRLAMVFQEPTTALNPVARVGDQVGESLRVHRGASRAACRARAVELLDEVGIANPSSACDAFPHQLSGGMRQRVMIAMALACDPELLIADEPTTALDVTTQAQILRLLRRLQRDRALALLFITHDLSLLPLIADQVAVMYAGSIVERADLPTILEQPRHPYTAALLRSLPRAGEDGRLAAIAGSVPIPGQLPAGCPFAPRCDFTRDRCGDQHPPLIDGIACYYPLAPDATEG